MKIDFHTTQSQLETMNDQDYAFFLAYGMTQGQEELASFIDSMYDDEELLTSSNAYQES